MNSFQIALNEVRYLLNDATKIDFENDGSVEMRLEIYRRYVKCSKEIFIILDNDLNSYSSENKLENLKSIHSNHSSILTALRNCVNRCIVQISEENVIQKKSSFSNSVTTEKCQEQRPLILRSLPGISSIDLLLAEKPVNPVASAKCNIQKLVNSTNALLKSDKLSVSERASIQLRIRRKIEENLSIAQRQEDQLCKLNTDNMEQLFKKIDEDIEHYQMFKDDSDFPLLYRNSQLFYYHILKDSRTYSFVRSSRTPESACLSFILKMSNIHPIVSFIDRSIERLLNCKNQQDEQNNFLGEIKLFKEKMENLSKLCCLIINTPLSDHIINIAQTLLVLLYDFIFRNPKLGSFVYNCLFEIYAEDMKQYDSNVKFIEDQFDHETLLPEKFKVQPDIIAIIDSQVLEFKNLRQSLNPLEKIDMLSKTVTDLMAKIQNQNRELEIGADELVPILVYMIMKFHSAELFLHGKYLEHLLPDSYLIGIEGYMLVTVICAITFCVSETFSQHIAKS